MTTNTQRHTARPSRARVALARVIGALSKAYDYAERHIVAVALALAAGMSVMLAVLVVFADNRYATAVIALAVCASVAFYVFVATDDATARQRDAYWRDYARRVITKHDEERAYWNTYCDQVAQRNEERNARTLALVNDARDERDLALREMRNAQRECSRMAHDLAKSGERMSASYEITKVERDALEEENANLSALIRALVSPLWADATRDDLRVWIMAGNGETAYANAFHNGEGVSLDDEITRREAYARMEEANR